jgi:hypothetical protein
MKHQLSTKVMTVATGLFGGVMFVACVVFGLLVPALHNAPLLEGILPGFHWLTMGSFVLGVVETSIYGAFAGLVFASLYNAVSRRLGPTPVVVAILAAATVAASMTGVLLPGRVWGQAPDRLQQIETQLSEKHAAAEAHRQQMEAIKDPDALNIEMRKHFQMTEEILALMLERRRLVDAQAPAPPASPPGGMSGGRMGGPPSGMPGGMRPEMGGMHGMGSGMMQKEMGGMQSGSQGAAMPGMRGSASASPTIGSATSDMDQMMKRITEHSTYMQTVKDQTAFQQEMLRHQKMLDQMMQLIQR